MLVSRHPPPRAIAASRRTLGLAGMRMALGMMATGVTQQRVRAPRPRQHLPAAREFLEAGCSQGPNHTQANRKWWQTPVADQVPPPYRQGEAARGPQEVGL